MPHFAWLGNRLWPHRGVRGTQNYPAEVAVSGGHSPWQKRNKSAVVV